MVRFNFHFENDQVLLVGSIMIREPRLSFVFLNIELKSDLLTTSFIWLLSKPGSSSPELLAIENILLM